MGEETRRDAHLKLVAQIFSSMAPHSIGSTHCIGVDSVKKLAPIRYVSVFSLEPTHII